MRLTKYFALGILFAATAIQSASAASLTWKGDGTQNVWSTSQSVKNWWSGSSATYFTLGDIVTFDDSGSNAVSVNLASALSWSSGTTGGSVIVNSSKNYVFAGSGYLSGGSTAYAFLTKSGTGKLTLNTVNDYIGQTVVNGGTLAIVGGGKIYAGSTGNPTNAAVTVNAGGTIEFDDWGGSFGNLSTVLTSMYVNGGTLRYVGSSGQSTLSSRGFVINGTGATLDAANAGSTWEIANGAGTIDTALIAVANNATLSLTGAGNGILDKGPYAVSNYVLNLVKNGSGTWTMTGSRESSASINLQYFYTGATTINEGTLVLNPGGYEGDPALGVLCRTSGITINSSGTLVLKGYDAITGQYGSATLKSVTINGGTLDTQYGWHKIAALTLNGGLVTSTSGVDSYNGSLGLNGDVAVTDNAEIRALYVNLSGTARTFNVAAGKTLNFSGSFINGPNFIKSGSGTVVLGGDNSYYTGAVTVNSGVMKLGAAANVSSATGFALASGATLDVASVSGGWKLSQNQALTGSGTVAGSVSDTTSGLVSVAAGGVGSVGTLSVQGNLNLSAGSGNALNFDLSSSISGGNDFLSVSGNLKTSGSSGITINIAALNNYLSNGTYSLIGFGSFTGSLSNFSLAGYLGSSRQSVALSSSGSAITLSVVGNPASLTWNGSASSYAWNVNSSTNWLNTGTAKSDVFINGDLVTFAGSGSATTSVNIASAVSPGSVTFKNNSTKNYVFTGSGYITGATGLTLEASNTAKIVIANSGSNDFTGAIAVNGGTLEFGDGVNYAAGQISANSAIIDNAVVSFNVSPSETLILSNSVSGTGTLQKNGSGSLTVTNANDEFTGQTRINAGKLTLGSASALGASAVTVAANASLDLNGYALSSYGLTIQGSGSDGSGALVNNGAIIYYTAIQSLTLNGGAAIGGNYDYALVGPLTGNGYNLAKEGSNEIGFYSVGQANLANVAIDSGKLTLQGSTSLGSSGTLSINYGATLSLSELTLAVGKKIAANDGATILSALGTNTISGTVALNGNVTVNASSALYVTGNVVGSSASVGSLTKVGTGVLTLTGTGNTWAAGTTISEGTLQIGDGGANGSLFATGSVANSGTLAFNSSSSIAFNGAISGAGALIQNGSGVTTLGGASSYAGATLIKKGTLALGAAGAISSSGTIDVFSGAKFNVQALSGGFSLANGQTLTGAGTVVGNVIISSGATVAPGDGLGKLTFANNLSLSSGSVVSYGVTGTSADLLSVGGTISLASGAYVKVVTNQVGTNKYQLASVTGTLSGSVSNLSVDNGGTRYTFTPTLGADGKSIYLTVAGSSKTLTWNGNYTTWDLNSSPAWNTSDTFYNADAVIFGSASSGTITLDGELRPSSVTILNDENSLSLDGAGKITGNVTLTKGGTGALHIFAANDYSGNTIVTNGTLVFRSAAAYANLTGNIVVQNGGTLNLRLFGETTTEPTPYTNLIQISGTGYAGQGALTIGINAPGNHGIVTKLELLGDSTISTGAQPRWDVFNPTPGDSTAGYIKGNGYALTKTGYGSIYLRDLGDTGLGDIFISSGTLAIQGSTGLGVASKTLNVGQMTTLVLYNAGTLYKQLSVGTNSNVYCGYGTATSITGTTTVYSGATFQAESNLALIGRITDLNASATINKTGYAALTLSGTTTLSGKIAVTTGALELAAGQSTINYVELAAGTTLKVTAGSQNVQTVAGTGEVAVSGDGVLVVGTLVADSLVLGSTTSSVALAANETAPVSVQAVPEPGTLAGFALCAFLFALRRLGRYASRK